MSSSACILFYGVRFEIAPEAVEDLLEDRTDPRIEAARAAQLDAYWANFGGADERYLLLVGKRLGIFGPENQLEASLAPDALRSMMTATDERLKLAGLGGQVALHIQWEEDV